ncbi:hypothetical protein H671_1g2829 [Cricetulus griseus]|nr:hypothetical protein H671_1g2829 [Cricetulus griseus]
MLCKTELGGQYFQFTKCSSLEYFRSGFSTSSKKMFTETWKLERFRLHSRLGKPCGHDYASLASLKDHSPLCKNWYILIPTFQCHFLSLVYKAAFSKSKGPFS